MSALDRHELVRNAVIFLADPKTQAAPLAQRIQFLEAKGLTGPEIEDALRQSTSPGSGAYPAASTSTYNYVPSPYAMPVLPRNQPWDWRDYFITAVVSGTLAYGAASLFRKFVYPHLQPPSSSAYEEDRDVLTAQFDAAERLLREIQDETTAVKNSIDLQKEKVDQTTEEVQSAVKEMREGELRTRDEMREMREEVNNVRDMLPKMIDRTKEHQNQSLAELQQEIKSLRALLLSRGPSISAGPSSPMPALAGRPTIPAWQLAPSSSPAPAAVENASPPLVGPQIVADSIPASSSSDKGKGMDTSLNGHSS